MNPIPFTNQYSNQPSIGLWNLTRLAETLLPLLVERPDAAVERAQDVLKTYAGTYHDAWLSGMRAKCGLAVVTDWSRSDEDKALVEALFNIMAENNADFTLVFYHLSRSGGGPSEHDDALRDVK